MATRLRFGCALVLGLTLSGALAAQDQDVPAGPMSAIDWLSDVIQAPPTLGPPDADIPRSATPERIEVAPLEETPIDGVGLLPRSVTGLPQAFWGPTPAAMLATLVRAQSPDLTPPARRLFKRILLTELDPPVDADTTHALFLARIDALLEMGALEEAQALVERAGVTADPDVFRRWFDISLLRRTENRACATLRATPDVAPTFSARIFCLARNRDWPAAALSLETARALGAITPLEADLMARFLDPDLFEDEPFPPLQRPITPLDFRMRAALGEAPPAATLPLAFNHALLGTTQGWKTRLEAAERLTRGGGLTPRQLFALYLEREPAASGGIWDRVDKVQQFDIALLANDTDRIAATLPDAARALRRAGLFDPFAQLYGVRVARLDLGGDAGRIAREMVTLTPEAHVFADRLTDPVHAALARGQGATGLARTPLQSAILGAFSTAPRPLPASLDQSLQDARLGEVTLRALRALGQAQPDPDDTETALRVLRQLGFEAAAREIALALVVQEGRA